MVIDLGEPRDEPEVSARPCSPRGRRKLGAVVALVALLAMGGAAPVRSRMVAVTIQATAADEAIVEDDTLYLLRANRWTAGADVRTVSAYRLPEATLTWQATLFADAPVRGISIVDEMLLATVEGQDVQTIAVRIDTGQELWRRPGWMQRTGAGHAVLLDSSSDAPQQISSVNLETGQLRWSLSFSTDELVLSDRGSLVRWTRSGLARVYDADSGALRASANLPPAEPEMFAQVVGDLLLAPGRVRNRPVVTAYGVDRLDRRWQADMDLRMEYVSGDCGDALCVGDANGDLRLVDIATGRTRWSATSWGYAHRVGPYLLAHGLGETHAPRTAVLDPADGHVVGDLGEWNASLPAEDGRMLGTRERGARVLVARIDPLALETQLLAVLAGVSECQPWPAAVVCRRGGGPVEVWRPRRGL